MFRCVRAKRTSLSCSHSWCVTGTPIYGKGPAGLGRQLTFLGIDSGHPRFGSIRFTAFICSGPTRWPLRTDTDDGGTLSRRLRPALRRRQKFSSRSSPR